MCFHMFLGGNLLDGSIPTELGKMQSLRLLNLGEFRYHLFTFQ